MVSVEGQALNAKYNNPSTTIAQSAVTEQGGDFAPTLRIGYALERWYAAIDLTKPQDRKASAWAATQTGQGPGDVLTLEKANREDVQSGIAAVIGYRKPLAEYITVNAFAGLEAWKTDTREKRSIIQSTYYQCGPAVCAGAPVTLIDEHTATDDNKVGGTFGTAIEFGDENIGIYIGIRHHTVMKSTGGMLGINAKF